MKCSRGLNVNPPICTVYNKSTISADIDGEEEENNTFDQVP
jgi:hypothetical protein